MTMNSATVQCSCVSSIYRCFILTRYSGHVCVPCSSWRDRTPNVVPHIGQQTMPQFVILKLTKHDSKLSVLSQCHLAASVENTVSQLLLVFTALTLRPIFIQMYNKISVNPFYGISEFLNSAMCYPFGIIINISELTLFNYFTHTHTHTHVFRTVLTIYIPFGEVSFFKSTLWSSLALPSHFRLSECYNCCGQNSFTCNNLLCTNKLHQILTAVNACWNSRTAPLMGFTVSLLQARCILI